MAKLQYRRTGAGEVAVYAHVIWNFWRKVEVLDYRMYETEGKLNDHIAKSQDLYTKHSKQFDEVRHALETITNDRQSDPYRSAPFDGPIPKDSKKYRKARSRPVNLWMGVRKAIIRACSFIEVVDTTPTVGTDVEIVGLTDQPIGPPVQDNRTKRQRNQQQQQDQH